jgi:RNA polymerase sigma-54 factor
MRQAAGEPSPPRSAPNSAPPSATTGRTAPSATTSTASARRPRAPAASRRRRRRRPTPQDRRAAGASLQDHLRAQIAGMRLGARRPAALNVLIESLNGDGYLADPLEEIAERLAEMLGGDDGRRRATSCWTACSCALRWLQSLEPPAWARAPGECLMPAAAHHAQTARRAGGHPHLREPPGAAGPARHEEADRADRRRRRPGARSAGLIVACEPKPGRPFTRRRGQHHRARRHRAALRPRLKVTLNPDVMPKLRINDLYAQAVRGQRGGSGRA